MNAPFATPTNRPPHGFARWRRQGYVIIFEHGTTAGLIFDVVLLVLILLSVLTVMLESVHSIKDRHREALLWAEYGFTLVFTIEYVARLLCVKSPRRYALSFFGIVDLLAILPTFISLLVPGAQSLLVIRGLRLLRVFRVLKLGQMVGEGRALSHSLWSAKGKIVVFLMTVCIAVTIMGAAMYLIEGPAHDASQVEASGNEAFASIPDGMYWAIVTMSTVGYGDKVPHTVPGKAMAAVIILFGYSLIVVPTGIVSAEFASGLAAKRSGAPPDGAEGADDAKCPRCGRTGHAADARYCDRCGERLPDV